MKTKHIIIRRYCFTIAAILFAVSYILCNVVPSVFAGTNQTPASTEMNIDQTLSDGAQKCTIAFDGFGFITGTFEAQSFFPPGKLADYWGFQYLRDNTSDGNGHNTSFLTNCAFNVLYLLNAEQFAMLKTLATNQVEQINLYGYKRFPLMKAFRRQLDGDIPTGSSGLSLDAVKAASSELYKLDGQISFDRAVVYASIFKTLDISQKTKFDDMAVRGFDSWTVSTEMESAVRELMKGVSHDVSVALMTYAGDLFSWYAGSLEADVYFCPERQGTYFGSFYIKDAPAIGHEGYKIDEALTANAGQYFIDQLATTGLDSMVTSLVDTQRANLYSGTNNIVKVRSDISTLLRTLISAPVITDTLKASVLAQVLEKSGLYGELDGEIVYNYTMAFAQVYQFMTDTQKANLAAMRKKIMSGTYNNTPFDFSVCTTPFLYSAVITNLSLLSPYISNTDYLFGTSTNNVVNVISVTPSSRNVANTAGTTTFSIANTGTGQSSSTGKMNWTASVTSGGSWLTIKSGKSGSNTGTVTCSYSANTTTSTRTATIRITAGGATGSPKDVTITQAAAVIKNVLAITPVSRNVSKDAGTTTFSISNTGNGTMAWTAAVTSGSSWLTIKSGANGSNKGIITCGYSANTTKSTRTAIVRITATGATGSPKDVKITQSATTSVAK